MSHDHAPNTVGDWTLSRDQHDIALLSLDCTNREVNTLTPAVLDDLSTLLSELEQHPPAGLIIRSGKVGSFIVGADIDQFAAVDSYQALEPLIRSGWDTYSQLEKLPFPTLALIDGHCLGGGLELALACRYRVAVDRPSAKLGLPEVMLGILPAWGGIKRLPELIGAAAALPLLLSGKQLAPRRAASLGIVDLVVAERVAEGTASHVVLNGIAPRKRSWLARASNTAMLKPLIAKRVRRDIERKDPHQHYPAPRIIAEVWEKHDGNPLEAPQQLDALIQSPVTPQLIRLFGLQEQLKGTARQPNVAPMRRVHVVGAGVMGGDIAAWCALKGFRVTLQDQDIERIAPAIGRAQQLFKRRLRRDKRAITAAFDRLIADPQGLGVASADVVIEAIGEQLEAKHALYQALEPHLKADAILATNTSSLALEALREGLEQPQRLIGIHFFNPVARMPLVEVVHTGDADSDAVQRACAFVGAIDKLPLKVKSTPGFLVNAVLAPYLLEAMRALDEGTSKAAIDTSMEAFGMPMGPLALADTVGLDVIHAAGSALQDAAQVPRCLTERLELGHLGRKSGRGFYHWPEGKRDKRADQESGDVSADRQLALRLITPLVEQTRQQLHNGIVESADLADAGVIFSTGYAPFSGGPLTDSRIAAKDDI
ncbi:Fatty acid oxidation complex subunit alpha [Carnimonas sp. R-84981]|uniref:3-hydroxyacyl-CoA dehydrogenase NAD-binding domain-containing protein n=1 Tax=Carnimonas bestiolae TaxID=3402172 RepID=UPI003EDBCB10